MKSSDPVFIAGHAGLVGSAIARRLKRAGYNNLITRSRSELDLSDRSAVAEFFLAAKPRVVIIAAAKVGGIMANIRSPYDFLDENLAIAANVITAAVQHRVAELVFLASSCIYPTAAQQPLKEEYLMTGPLEDTNEGYAMAKLAGIYLCKTANKQFGTRYFALLPCNIYGPGDNYDPAESHLVASMIRKATAAKKQGSREIEVWGTGRAIREQLHVDDCADACVYFLENDHGEFLINVGTGVGHPTAEIAMKCAQAAGIDDPVLRFDTSKPDGMSQKVLDVSLACKLGWTAKLQLDDGLLHTVKALDPLLTSRW